jgi:hypothetical protein
MSTDVIGLRPPDARWKLMKAVYDACVDAKLGIPEDVNKFFGFNRPDPKGVEVVIPHKEWTSDRGSSGIEINVNDIPKDVKVIRFYNSW